MLRSSMLYVSILSMFTSSIATACPGYWLISVNEDNWTKINCKSYPDFMIHKTVFFKRFHEYNTDKKCRISNRYDYKLVLRDTRAASRQNTSKDKCNVVGITIKRLSDGEIVKVTSFTDKYDAEGRVVGGKGKWESIGDRCKGTFEVQEADRADYCN